MKLIMRKQMNGKTSGKQGSFRSVDKFISEKDTLGVGGEAKKNAAGVLEYRFEKMFFSFE